MAAVERLVDIGMDLAEAMHRQATDPDAPKVFPGDLALAFSRISRAIRLTLILAQRLQDGLPDVVAEVEAEAREAAPVEAANDVDEDEGERLIVARGDRENEETVWLKRPASALVAQICRDLDTRYDAELWGDAPEPMEHLPSKQKVRGNSFHGTANKPARPGEGRDPDLLALPADLKGSEPIEPAFEPFHLGPGLRRDERIGLRNPSSDLLRRPPSPARGEGRPLMAASEYRPP